jgi:hypothetical protein
MKPFLTLAFYLSISLVAKCQENWDSIQVTSQQVKENIKVSEALKKGKRPEELAGLGITNAYEAEWGKGFIKGKDFVVIVAAGLQGKGN